MRDVAHEAEPVTGADHLSAELRQPVMPDRAGLEIADVVWRVVHELQVADAALMRFLQPFKLAIQKIEALDIRDDGRLPGFVRRFEISSRKRAK